MKFEFNNVLLPAGPGQVVAYTTTTAIANALPVGAFAVWVWCTTAAYVKVGTSPTATNVDIPVPANTPVVIPIGTNDGTIKVAALQETTGGNLHVLPIAAF